MGGGASKTTLAPTPGEDIPCLLLLGEGGVGKSSILKHMAITNGIRLAPEEIDGGLNAILKSLIHHTLHVMHTLADEIDHKEQHHGECRNENREMMSLQTLDNTDMLYEDFDTVTQISARGKFEINNARQTHKEEKIATTKKMKLAQSTGHLSKKMKSAARSVRRMSLSGIIVPMPKRGNQDQTELQSALLRIWKNHEVKQCSTRIQKMGNFEDELTCSNAKIARENLGNMFAPDFTLPDDKTLQVCAPTTVMKRSVELINNQRIEIIDVGGKKHFQTEWDVIIEQHQAKSFICFCVSLHDFSFREKGTNRLEESLETWKKMLAKESVSKLPIILIFNKRDLFIDTLARVSLEVCPILDAALSNSDESDPEKFADLVETAIKQLFTSQLKEKHILLGSIVTSATNLPPVKSNFTSGDQYKAACKATGVDDTKLLGMELTRLINTHEAEKKRGKSSSFSSSMPGAASKKRISSKDQS